MLGGNSVQQSCDQSWLCEANCLKFQVTKDEATVDQNKFPEETSELKLYIYGHFSVCVSFFLEQLVLALWQAACSIERSLFIVLARMFLECAHVGE